MTAAENICLLTSARMQETITRMAFQILESQAESSALTLLGVGKRGLQLAKQLSEQLQPLGNFSLHTGHLHILRSKTHQPTDAKIVEKVPCNGKKILLIDDVLNTGRTLAVCLAEVMKQTPKQVHTAVLVARSHTLFPIEVNFVGKHLHTTLDDYVEVQFGKQAGVYLR